MSRVIYAEAVAARGPRVWCHNCGESLSHLRHRFADPKDHLRITNVKGTTVISDEAGLILHRCDE